MDPFYINASNASLNQKQNDIFWGHISYERTVEKNLLQIKLNYALSNSKVKKSAEDKLMMVQKSLDVIDLTKRMNLESRQIIKIWKLEFKIISDFQNTTPGNLCILSRMYNT